MIWDGITGSWAKKRTFLSQPTSCFSSLFYGPLLHFNIFQSCQVVSVLFGLDIRGRIVRDYLDILSTSPAAQQRIVVCSSSSLRHKRDGHKCLLRNLIGF